MTEEILQQQTEPTEQPSTPKKAGLWADLVLIVVHAAAAAYWLWVFVVMIPQYKQICLDFSYELPRVSESLIKMSEILIQKLNSYSLRVAVIVSFVSLEFALVKVTEGTIWRKIWLFGFILFPLGLAALVQAHFFYLITAPLA